MIDDTKLLLMVYKPKDRFDIPPPGLTYVRGDDGRIALYQSIREIIRDCDERLDTPEYKASIDEPIIVLDARNGTMLDIPNKIRVKEIQFIPFIENDNRIFGSREKFRIEALELKPGRYNWQIDIVSKKLLVYKVTDSIPIEPFAERVLVSLYRDKPKGEI